MTPSLLESQQFARNFTTGQQMDGASGEIDDFFVGMLAECVIDGGAEVFHAVLTVCRELGFVVRRKR